MLFLLMLSLAWPPKFYASWEQQFSSALKNQIICHAGRVLTLTTRLSGVISTTSRLKLVRRPNSSKLESKREMEILITCGTVLHPGSYLMSPLSPLILTALRALAMSAPCSHGVWRCSEDMSQLGPPPSPPRLAPQRALEKRERVHSSYRLI